MTADNSDTESDSEGSDAQNIPPASGPGSQSGTILQIIQTLQSLTSFPHEGIEAASSSLVRFVDDISWRLENGANTLEVLTTFALLVKPTFLNKLFEYRLFCRNAANSQTNTRSLKSTLVTWVDVLLASLSFSTVVVAAAASEEVQLLDQGVSETIKLQKRRDSIRAATQLPDNWPKLALVVGSSNYSPAAKRIALSLLFAVYVIGPQLEVTKSDPWAHDSSPPADVLTNMYLGARHLSAQKPLLSGFSSTIQERINAALLISLFAVTDSAVKSRNLAVIGPSSLRPDGYGYLLELIRTIINEDAAIRMPSENLDVPQTILLRWGSVVPWTWSTWDDLRVANSEYLRVVTTTWLYHLNSPFFAGLDHTIQRRIFGIDFRAILFQDCEASTRMVSNRLRYDLHSARMSFEGRNEFPLATSRVLVKSCWAVVQYLEANAICPDPVIERRIPEYSRCILSLFLFLDVSEEDNFVKGLMIEALSMVQPSSLRTELQIILREDSGHFLPRLDEATRQTLSYISGSRDNDVEHNHGVEASKHLLGFLTLIAHTDIKNCTLQGIISSYLSALVKLLKLKGPDSFQTRVLQDALLVALSVLKATKMLCEDHYDGIWNLTILSKKRNMIASSTFAQYLLASDPLCDALICHESWDVFRDVLTAIINHNIKEEEYLALLVSPILCRALTKLIASSQVSTRHRLLCSPWTMNLRLALRKLLGSSTTLLFLKTLKNRLEHDGKMLLDEVGRFQALVQADGLEKTDSFELKTRMIVIVVYCLSRSRSRVIQSWYKSLRRWPQWTQMSIESHIKRFATTSAEFNLTARPVKPRCPHTCNSVDQTLSRSENLTELIRLRSSAFWELRQSIAENGEGFVRRMRDYEGSRSRHNIHRKVKEAEKRGRKRSSKTRAAIDNSSDISSDEDDIQICSGDSASSILKLGRGRSQDAMDVDSKWHMRPCRPCGPQYSSSLQLDSPSPTEDTEPSFSSSIVSSSPSSPRSPYEPSQPSPTSPPSCEPLSLTTDHDLLSSTTSYHKVIASLNLALANGAGSVEDYSSLWEYQSRFQAEYYDQGDLWH